VLAILDLFTLEHPVWSPDAICDRLGCSRPTGYRYIKELVDAGLLQKTGAARYAMGKRIIQLDYEMRQSDPVLVASMGVMADLAQRIGFTVVLSAMFGDQVIDIHHAGQPPDELPFAYARGKPRPLFSGAAPKVILPSLPRATLVRLYRTHHQKIAASGLGETWVAFRRHLASIRKDGFYLSLGELGPNIAGAAVPVYNNEGDVLAALAAGGSVREMERVDIAKLRAELFSAEAHIRARL